MCLIPIETEPIPETARLTARHFDAAFANGFELRDLSCMNFEIWNDGATRVFGCHNFSFHSEPRLYNRRKSSAQQRSLFREFQLVWVSETDRLGRSLEHFTNKMQQALISIRPSAVR